MKKILLVTSSVAIALSLAACSDPTKTTNATFEPSSNAFGTDMNIAGGMTAVMTPPSNFVGVAPTSNLDSDNITVITANYNFNIPAGGSCTESNYWLGNSPKDQEEYKGFVTDTLTTSQSGTGYRVGGVTSSTGGNTVALYTVKCTAGATFTANGTYTVDGQKYTMSASHSF